MTELTKPISRITTLMLDNRAQVRQRDRVVVTLYPGKVLGFRPYGCRKGREVHLDLAVAWKLALIEAAKEKQKLKKRGRK